MPSARANVLRLNETEEERDLRIATKQVAQLEGELERASNAEKVAATNRVRLEKELVLAKEELDKLLDG